MNTPTSIAVVAANKPVNRSLSLLMDVEAFSHMQRVGKMLALSPLFPEHLRKGSQETAIANGVLVLNMASRLNEDPLTVAQNIYFVGGKPGWSASYMIAKANQCGVFRDPIDWTVKGKGDTLEVEAFAFLSSTGKRVSVTITMAMAKAEGWTKNSKYQSIPEQMFRYRGATFLIRLYCPEVRVGVPSTVELEGGDYRDITPEYVPSESKAEPATQNTTKQSVDTIDTAETVDPETGEFIETVAEESKPQREAAEAVDPASMRKDEPPKQQASLLPEETAPAAKTTRQADPEQFVELASLIMRELDEGSDVELIREAYGPQIEQMRSVSPDLAKKIEDRMAQIAD